MKRWLIALPIAVLGGLWVLSGSHEMWFDERFVQVLSSESFSRMLALVRLENTPPVFFVAAWIWQRIVGVQSDALLRVVTLGPSLVTLWLAYRDQHRRHGLWVAIAVGMLIAGSNFFTYASAEYRTYSLGALMSLAIALLVNRYDRHPNAKTAWAFAGLSVAAVLTHYLLLIPVLAGWLMLLLSAQKKIQIIVPAGAALLAGVPWSVYSIALRPHADSVPGPSVVFTGRWEALLPWHVVVDQYAFSGLGSIIFFLSVCIVGVALALGMRSAWTHARAGSRSLMVHAVIVVSGVAVTSALGLSLLRYAMILAPSLVIVMVHGLMQHRNALTVGLLVFVSASAGWSSYARATHPDVRYRATFARMDVRSTDRVLVFPFNDAIAVTPYQAWPTRPVGFFPLKSPGETTLDDIVLYNYRKTLTFETVDRLGEYVAGADRVWFMYHVWSNDLFSGNIIDEWFLAHGYNRIFEDDSFHGVAPLVVRYDKVNL